MDGEIGISGDDLPACSEFRAWVKASDLTAVEIAAIIGVSPTNLRLYCRPFGDPLRQAPRERVLEKIVALTGGVITVENFAPPHLRARREAAE